MTYYFNIEDVASDAEKETVFFIAEGEGKKVRCSVSWKILREHFSDGEDEEADPEWSNPFWWYVNNQHVFTKKAEELILAGRFEPDGSIVLRLADVSQERESENDDLDIPRIPVDELPFKTLQPDSMSLADISAWYRYMVPRVEEFVSGISDPLEKLTMAWRLKREIRRASAAAIIEKTLIEEFYRTFSFKRFDVMLEKYRNVSPNDSAESIAFRALVSLTEKEKSAYPGRAGGEVKHWVDGKAVFLSNGAM